MAKRERSAPVIHDDGFTINGCVFHVDAKYKPIDAIGQGSYGVVCSVRNSETNEKLAIKKITPMAGDEWDATHTLREIRLMRCLGAHENIISLKDLSMREDKDELYMMMELADTDLHRLIQSSCPLTEGHIRVIMFQILSGVKAMHDNGVLHRDLKPGNLLLNKDCELKITDFGLARMMPKDRQANDVGTTTASVVSPMTEYVVTRWYRPPELMLAPNGCYDGAVDMWSVGCILGELINRKPMFPGTDFMDQLTRVFKVVSIPDKDHRGYSIEKDALKFLQSLPTTPENAMEKLFKSGPAQALDLMKKLLCFNPKERISADEALAHPFFDGVKEEWGEIAELKLGHSLEFAFEQQSLPLSTLRSYICDEVRAFKEKEATDKKKQAVSSAPEMPEGGHSDPAKAQPKPVHAANDMPAGRGFTIKGCDFNVPPQYKPLQVLGEGSYGIVCAATDGTSKKSVAIKKITPMAGDEWDAKHTLREIRLMRYFGHHPNIASLQNLSTCTEKDELYIMMDLVDTDLHRLIQSKTKLEEAHIAAIMYQLLCGAKVLHDNGVLHRDLKPGNILVSKNCDVKITDFGLSRYIPHGGRPQNASANGHEKGKDLMTEYVVTRWYRAPEIMLSPNGTYGEAIDMWSIGCIFGELLNRKPMFPGSDFIDQLTRVFSVLPVPAADKRGYSIEGDALKFLESLPACSPDAITKLFRRASPEAVSLLRRLLCVNPERRINAKQALAHPYFKTIRQQLGEPPEFHLPKEFDFEFDYQEFTLGTLRQLIQDEVKLLQQDRQDATKKKDTGSEEQVEATQHTEKKSTAPHEKETQKALTEKKTKPASPITASAPAPTATTTARVPNSASTRHAHSQQEDSDEEDDLHDDERPKPNHNASKPHGPVEFLAPKPHAGEADSSIHRTSEKASEQKPEFDDDDSVASEASSSRSQQKHQSTTASISHSGTTNATKKAPTDPEDDCSDDDDREQEIIQVERPRPVSGRLDRPRSATGTAASAAAARRAAAAAAANHKGEDELRHNQARTGQQTTGNTSNNESTERWGHTRPAAVRAHSSVHSTSSGATAIMNRKQPLNSSAAAASRLLSSRTTLASSSASNTSMMSNQSSASLLNVHKDNDDKSDAYRHPERAVASSRTAITSRTTSTPLGSSASTKEILPDGWIKRIHSKSGREYYYDTVNKVSSWKHPSKMDNIFGNNHHENNNTSGQLTSRTSSSSRVALEQSTSATISRRTVSSSSLSSSSAALPKESSTKEPSLSSATPSTSNTGPSSGSSKETLLPKDWERRTDPKTGRLFYVNLVTKKAFARLPSSVSASILNLGREAISKKTVDPVKKKTSTVPQSPAFSQMSWQKKRVPTADE